MICEKPNVNVTMFKQTSNTLDGPTTVVAITTSVQNSVSNEMNQMTSHHFVKFEVIIQTDNQVVWVLP